MPISTSRAAEPFDLALIARGLAAASLLESMPAALRESRTAVVEAPPGSGKTTIVPPLVANVLARQADGPDGGASGATAARVIVTQPRRIAARAAARRLAELTNTRVGELAGFSVRGDRAVSDATRVEFVTDGLLLRRLLADPELSGVGAVVLDEVHERSVDGDLVFAMLREVAELRDDLRLVAMSATLDAERWASLLGGLPTSGSAADAGSSASAPPAPILSVASSPHPLEVRWAPPPARVQRLDARGVNRDFLDHVARTAAAHAASGGSTLVFVPGAWEVDRVVEAIRAIAPRRADGEPMQILPLHGRLPQNAQQVALAGESGERIIVSTDVAESSLTVAGVRRVIDAGLGRQPRLDLARGVSRLVTVRVSRASAIQRAGRAARLGPGEVVRCYAESDWAAMPAEQSPEIETADLVPALLALSCWGAPRGQNLALPDPVPRAAGDAATATLRELGAIDADERATRFGRALALVPADPRHARALLVAAELVPAGAASRVAEAVATIASDERAPGGDVSALQRRLRNDRGTAGSRWRDDARRFERIVERSRRERNAETDAGARDAESAALAKTLATQRLGDDELLGLVTALAHPDRIARRRNENDPHDYLLTSGTGARLPSDSALAGQEWIAIAELGAAAAGGDARAAGRGASSGPSGGARGGPGGAPGAAALIRSAVPVRPEVALFAARAMRHERTTTEWTGRRVAARRTERLGAIELVTRPVEADAVSARAAVADALRARGLEFFSWPDGAVSLRARLALLHRALGAPWPDASSEALRARADEWLAPELDAIARGTDPQRVDMHAALQRLLPWPEAAKLDELAPERLEVPSGSRIRLHYPHPDDADGRVVLAAKLQECFGMHEAPRIARGRVPVLLHLLSPARRPLAVTEDLAFFWREAYPHVRAENRGRYAKHPWPEDPLTAPARKGTSSSGR